jgi:hypothetical protein
MKRKLQKLDSSSLFYVKCCLTVMTRMKRIQGPILNLFTQAKSINMATEHGYTYWRTVVKQICVIIFEGFEVLVRYPTLFFT